jgi:hypothetical protein
MLNKDVLAQIAVAVRYCLLIFALLFLFTSSLFAETPVLLQNNDHDCELSIDGRDMGAFAANASKSIPLQTGNHLFVCLNSGLAKVREKRRDRAIPVDSSVDIQISGPNQIVVKLPRLSVKAKKTYGALGKITANTNLVNDLCRLTTEPEKDMTEIVTIVDGAIISCDGVGSYLLVVGSHRHRYLVPMQQLKLLVPSTGGGSPDTLFDIRADE